MTAEHPPMPPARQVGRGGLPRVDTAEWLDLGHGTPADVAANLAEMARLNRWLGGQNALARHLYPRLAHAPRESRVLDLGTGGAGGAIEIARWARKRGLATRVAGLDWAARNLAVARAGAAGDAGVALLQADARQLPLAPRSVDFIVSNLLLHHFPPAAARSLLAAAFAAARRSLVFSDLVRGRLPLLAFRLVQPVLARHPFTRHDGSLSIRRAYTPAEVRALAAEAGLVSARVHVHFPWRVTLVVDREPHDG